MLLLSIKLYYILINSWTRGFLPKIPTNKWLNVITKTIRCVLSNLFLVILFNLSLDEMY